MIVVFEGCDGVGKSTMVEAVKAAHLAAGHAPETVSIWHAGPFPEGSNAWNEYVVPLSSLTPTKDWLVIIDRWHIGELVYGPIFRGQSRLTTEQRHWIDGYLHSLGAVIVYLKATYEEISRRLNVRGDDMVKQEHIPPILAKYEEVLGIPWKCKTITHDTTNQRTEPMAEAIYLATGVEAVISLHRFRHPSDINDQLPYWETHPWPS
jgi:thymidylate kinase